MNKTKALVLLLCGVLVTGCSSSKGDKKSAKDSKKDSKVGWTVPKQKPSAQPNVVMLALDDLNDWINPLGSTQAKTPNFTRLANMGVNFTNAHAPNSYCAPSRTAIWTGLQSSTTGCYTNEIFHYDYPDLVPIQMAFKQGGYKTYGAGKLYHHRGGYLDLRSWDEFYTRTEEVRLSGYEMGYRGKDLPLPDPYPYSPYYTKQGKEADGGLFLEWAPIPDALSEQMVENKRTNWACDILKRDHTDPFFLAVGLYAPHFPNYAPKKYFDMYNLDDIVIPDLDISDLDDLPQPIRKQMLKRRAQHHEKLEELGLTKEAYRAYLACVSYADAMLGRLLDTLEASPYVDNTVVVIWSDQGYHHGEKGQWGKHTMWKQTSHVPFMFAGNHIKKNIRVDATVGLIDIYPTLIELCKLPKQHNMDGRSLVPALRGEPLADKDLLVPFHKRESYSVINSNWRYIHYNNGTEELYDLNNDPDELKNIASDSKYKSEIESLKQSAPKKFRKPATAKKSLKLVVEKDKMYWVSKKGEKPQMSL